MVCKWCGRDFPHKKGSYCGFCRKRDRNNVTPSEMIKELRYLSSRMISCGVNMDYYGGFADIGVKGRELIGAGKIAAEWVEEWQKDIRKG